MDAYLGEIRLFAGNFAPSGWAFCNGQLLPISQNTALFSVIGTRFGGDGQTNFALPDMRGSAPMNQGAGAGLTPRNVGDQVGSATVTLDNSSIPAHTHSLQAIDAKGTQKTPTNNYWSQSQSIGVPPHASQISMYAATPDVSMSSNAISVSGGSLPHNNMQPFLALNYIICLNGIFPPRN